MLFSGPNEQFYFQLQSESLVVKEEKIIPYGWTICFAKLWNVKTNESKNMIGTFQYVTEL